MKRRTFVSGSAALAAAGFASTTAQAASIKPYSWDLNPPTDTRENFIAWGKAPRRGSGVPRPALGPLPGPGPEQGHLGPGHHPRLPADAARGVLGDQSGDPQARLRARLPRHRLRRHHVGPARPGPHDQRDRRQARREGAGDRHRLGRAVGLHRQPDRERLHDRDHRAVGGPHPRPLRQADREGLHRVQAHQDQGGRRLLRLGRGRALRQDHRDLRHRPRAAAAAAAAEGGRPDGDPGRPAGRAARAQGHQDARRRRLDHHDAARTSTAARSCRSCLSPRWKATRSSVRTTADRRMR